MFAELRRSPRIAKLLTPEKTLKSSPNGVVVKALDFDYQNGVEGSFEDEWELNDFEEVTIF